MDDRKQGEGQNQVLKDTEAKMVGHPNRKFSYNISQCPYIWAPKATGQALGIEVLIKSFSRGEGLLVTKVQCG